MTILASKCGEVSGASLSAYQSCGKVQMFLSARAVFEVGCFENFLKKMMNKLKVRPLCP